MINLIEFNLTRRADLASAITSHEQLNILQLVLIQLCIVCVLFSRILQFVHVNLHKFIVQTCARRFHRVRTAAGGAIRLELDRRII